MTTTHPDPHTCARGVELRTAEEMLVAMDDAFDYGMSQRELRLWKAGVAAVTPEACPAMLAAVPASPA